jgi:hypothetical protein
MQHGGAGLAVSTQVQEQTMEEALAEGLQTPKVGNDALKSPHFAGPQQGLRR